MPSRVLIGPSRYGTERELPSRPAPRPSGPQRARRARGGHRLGAGAHGGHERRREGVAGAGGIDLRHDRRRHGLRLLPAAVTSAPPAPRVWQMSAPRASRPAASTPSASSSPAEGNSTVAEAAKLGGAGQRRRSRVGAQVRIERNAAAGAQHVLRRRLDRRGHRSAEPSVEPHTCSQSTRGHRRRTCVPSTSTAAESARRTRSRGRRRRRRRRRPPRSAAPGRRAGRPAARRRGASAPRARRRRRPRRPPRPAPPRRRGAPRRRRRSPAPRSERARPLTRDGDLAVGRLPPELDERFADGQDHAPGYGTRRSRPRERARFAPA